MSVQRRRARKKIPTQRWDVPAGKERARLGVWFSSSVAIQWDRPSRGQRGFSLAVDSHWSAAARGGAAVSWLDRCVCALLAAVRCLPCDRPSYRRLGSFCSLHRQGWSGVYVFWPRLFLHSPNWRDCRLPTADCRLSIHLQTQVQASFFCFVKAALPLRGRQWVLSTWTFRSLTRVTAPIADTWSRTFVQGKVGPVFHLPFNFVELN